MEWIKYYMSLVMFNCYHSLSKIEVTTYVYIQERAFETDEITSNLLSVIFFTKYVEFLQNHINRKNHKSLCCERIYFIVRMGSIEVIE